jgi:hypothetical protein
MAQRLSLFYGSSIYFMFWQLHLSLFYCIAFAAAIVYAVAVFLLFISKKSGFK